MLDTNTKRRIDTARDILVGKVPDPKSQVEQITIALIYKFMDDMDAESEELGGKRKFFAGEFARYGWAKLMRSGLGGHETLNLYAEAISKMPENPGIPPLFREIFKNAYLPYRDPETLRAFLKIIDEFEYDHSERLGDAFEYLLSVLGSQGEAGQFRTPRHIIDFIVAIIDPKKNETVLDPACGTAGFLISSYKHILRANSSPGAVITNGGKNGDEAALHVSKIPLAKGDLLTPDDRGRLAQNFKGYDISPDMVRLSLVNMYLHGFNDPHIFEYDTLTSLDKWNEYADVILANPPFMSPKGGIKPHNRFSVQSKRSEVLFVDYMAEHMTPNGRAGIIVPEGIIFQSQTAYKQLRKMLVEEYLVAVVSLPAGVFNPYSGVKTSILILDKALAKKANTIAFFKIENDGFGLGAQRRPIDKNDIPQVRAEIIEYLRRLCALESIEDLNPSLGLVVPKDKIAMSGDYNLSGARYREGVITRSAFPHALIRDVSEIITKGTTPTTAGFSFEDSGVNFIKIESVTEDGKIIPSKVAHISNQAHSALLRSQLVAGDVLFSIAGAMGRSAVVDESLIPANTNQALAIIRLKQELVSPFYLSHLLRSSQTLTHVESVKAGVAQYNISLQQVGDIEIPVPPLEVQKKIVAEIEGYQKVIDGARAVIDNYRPHIPIDPDWPMVRIGDLVIMASVGVVKSKGEQDWKLRHPYIKMNNITTDGQLELSSIAHVDASPEEIAQFTLQDGDYIYNTRNSPELVGKSAVFHGENGVYLFNNNILRIRFSELVHPDFVNTIMSGPYGRSKIRAQVDGTTSVAALYQRNYFAIEIPLPPLATQQTIVAEIEAERALVNANRELIPCMEKKIQATLARVWGEEETRPG